MINKTTYGNVKLDNKVFKDIAFITCEKVKGVTPVKNSSDFCSVSVKDSEVKLTLKVKLDTGVDVVKACNKLSGQVHEVVEEMTGIDLKAVNVDIQGFNTDDKKTA